MLFRSIEEFQEYIPVNKAFTLKLIAKYLVQAEQEYIKPVLGAALYTQLKANFVADVTDERHLALLHQVRLITSSLAFHRYLPFNTVQFSDSGARVVQDENYRSASKWQIEKIEDSTEQDGFDFIEELILFLEENRADYPNWDFANTRQYFIVSATAFNEEVYINNSRLLYLKLLPQLKRVERQVRSRISKNLFNDLKGKQLDTDYQWTEWESELMEYLRTAIANLTFAGAVRTLPVEIEGKRLSIFNNQFISDFDPKVQPDADVLGYMVRQHQEQGEESLQSAIYFMEMNIEEFPLYRDSECYTAPEDEQERDIEDSGFFIL